MNRKKSKSPDKVFIIGSIILLIFVIIGTFLIATNLDTLGSDVVVVEDDSGKVSIEIGDSQEDSIDSITGNVFLEINK